MSFFPGSPDDDTLPGSNSDDVMRGEAGNDLIYGWDGNDLILAGEGNDTVYAGDYNDTIYGGLGDDMLQGGGNIDAVYGGAGNDTLHLGLLFNGSVGVAEGGAGNDTVQVFETDGLATVGGGSGLDTLSITWPSLAGVDAANINFATQSASSAGGLTLTYSGFEQLSVYLGAGDDTVTGSNHADRLWVLAGSNVVTARGGDDLVYYNMGAANTLRGGLGDDRLIAMVGRSSVYFIVDLYDGDVDDGQLSQITGFEHYDVIGGSLNDIISTGNGNDVLYGNQGDDTLQGMAGHDSMTGEQGLDQLDGGAGRDTLRGGDGADTLNGGSEADLLIGNAGNDVIFGGDGRDVINGRRGDDTLTGDAGPDHFNFNNPNPGLDLITDFTTGEDRIIWGQVYLGPAAPAVGMVTDVALSDGGPVGTGAQFVTVYDALSDETALHYFDAGTSTHGSFLLLRLGGQISLQEGDLWLV